MDSGRLIYTKYAVLMATVWTGDSTRIISMRCERPELIRSAKTIANDDASDGNISRDALVREANRDSTRFLARRS